MNLKKPYKIGDCILCQATNTHCIKRGKNLFCLNCAKIAKVKEQIAKQEQKIKSYKYIPDYDSHQISKISVSKELNKWFKERRNEMTGICAHCGGNTEMTNDGTFKFSIAHILPKAYFPSVATHPLNFIELCFWVNSCHTNYDNKSLDIKDLNCFDDVVKKFRIMYPSIPDDERKRISEILIKSQ